MHKLFEVIFEDDDLLVINKPAGLVCHPTKGDEYSSLISRTRLYLGPEKTPYMVNRLDRETSGVVMVAKSSEFAGLLGKLWENRAVIKIYRALVHGHVEQESGVIEAPLGKDETSITHIKDCVRTDGVSARTEYFVEGRFERDGQKYSSVRVQPLTGRKHQIRIHLQYLGHPIVGDKLYGLNEGFYLAFVKNCLTPEDWRTLVLPWQALHAAEVRLVLRGEQRIFCAKPEVWFQNFSGSENDFYLVGQRLITRHDANT